MKHARIPALLALLLAALLAAACSGQAGAPQETEDRQPEATAAPSQAPETVTFQCGATYPLDAEEVTVALAAGETALLERFTGLRVAEVTGSVDYEELAAYAAAHPEVELRFCEEIGGVEIAHDAVSLDLTAVPLSELERVLAVLPLLPALEEVNVNRAAGAPVPDGADAALYAGAAEGAESAAETAEAAQDVETPEAGAEATQNAETPEADAEAGAAETFATALDWGQLGRLQQARPDVRFDYVFTYLGKTFSTADETVDLSGLKVGNARVDEVRALAGYLTACRELTMERCNVGNEQMAALRDALPGMKVVWRVSFGKASSRTDATRIRLVKDGYRFSTKDLEPLRYCVDVELLDLGHNGLRNIEFVRYMPKLRVAILAIGYLEDLTPLEGCTQLEYLELFTNRISDLTPLAGLTSLRHLNLTYNRITDPSPLHALTGLERLWIGRTSFTDEQKAALQAALPGCEIDYGSAPTGDGWRKHPRYEQLREEFDYDHPRNGGY